VNILIVEPYYTGSHAAWAEGYKKNSRHDVQILSMPGRYWKWRMHGGAVTLAKAFLARGSAPELILATDMLDLTTFCALTRPLSNGVPTAIYFHENQITYPWAEDDRDRAKGRDGHYAFINFASALTADRVFFNSSFHKDSFLQALERYLKAFPDFNVSSSIEEIEKKSAVLYVGMDFRSLDTAAAAADESTVKTTDETPPLILWNHRWEHDKNPEDFFRALYILMEKGLDFEVAILGENFQKSPAVFDEAHERLGKRILHFGFVKDYAQYARWLKRADIVPVTSRHDFFGCSVVEAIYCGAFPILPRRLAYPEHLGENSKKGAETCPEYEKCFYENFDEFLAFLEWTIINIDEARGCNAGAGVARYGWDNMAPLYDREMEKAARAALRQA